MGVGGQIENCEQAWESRLGFVKNMVKTEWESQLYREIHNDIILCIMLAAGMTTLVGRSACPLVICTPGTGSKRRRSTVLLGDSSTCRWEIILTIAQYVNEIPGDEIITFVFIHKSHQTNIVTTSQLGHEHRYIPLGSSCIYISSKNDHF